MHKEGDVGIAVGAFLLRNLVEVSLVREIAHRRSGPDAIKELSIGQKVARTGTAE